MNNHFGKGLMAGLKATHADSAVNVTKFCADYKRGFVLGYSHRMYEKTGDRQAAVFAFPNGTGLFSRQTEILTWRTAADHVKIGYFLFIYFCNIP